jgi:hypothetical protein
MSTARSRVEQRDHLLTGVGYLLDPLRRLIENLDAERSKARHIDAQFDRDSASFLKEVMSVCQSGTLTDDTILHLGGSAAHASFKAPYTVSTLDPSQSNHLFLDAIIAGADEWFGPTLTTHRKN